MPGVLVDAPLEEHVHALLVEVGDGLDEGVLVVNPVDGLEPRLHHAVALRVDAVQIHACLVVSSRGARVLFKDLRHISPDAV